MTVAGVDAKRSEEAVKVIKEEYGVIASETGKITEQEIQKAKEFLKGHLVLELEDSRSVAGFYAHQELLEKKIDNPDEVLVKIDTVDVSQVKKAAEAYLRRPLNLAVIGDFEEKEKFEQLLK